MSRVTIGVVNVRDQHGRAAIGSAQDPDCPIRLGGLLTANGEPTEYIGPGVGVKSGAIRNGLKYRIHQLELDLNSRRVIAWTVLN
jgi:hypothetical protein